MQSISYTFATRTRWQEEPLVSISGLSCVQDTVTIRLPKGNYTRVGTFTEYHLMNVVIDATFSVKQDVSGTPLQVVGMLSRSTLQPGELLRHTEGHNVWLLGREVCILNGKVAYLMLPTSPKTLLIGANLMVCTSKVSKVLKERVIPDLVMYFGNDITTRIVNSDSLRVDMAASPTELVLKDKIRDILLEHIDEIV